MGFFKREERIEPTDLGPVRIAGVPPMSELLNLGTNEKTFEAKDPRTGAVTIRTAEYRLLCHRKHRSRFYIQWGDGPPEPLNHNPSRTTTVTPLGTIRDMNRPSGRYQPASPDSSYLIE